MKMSENETCCVLSLAQCVAGRMYNRGRVEMLEDVSAGFTEKRRKGYDAPLSKRKRPKAEVSERGFVITVKGYCYREASHKDPSITSAIFNAVLWPQFESWLQDEAEAGRVEYGLIMHEELWELFQRWRSIT